MNKTELIAAMAAKAEITKKDAEAALKAFVDVVTEELSKKEKAKKVSKLDQLFPEGWDKR